MSAKQVTPDRIISAQPSRVPSRDEVGADERPLDRHHVAHQPDVEPQVVGEAAQQRHRHVRVRVDQSGHDDAAAAVDRLAGLIGQRAGPDRRDGITRDGDRARRDGR